MNTQVDEYLLSYKLRSNKKSILFANQRKFNGLGKLQSVYKAATMNSKNLKQEANKLLKA